MRVILKFFMTGGLFFCNSVADFLYKNGGLDNNGPIYNGWRYCVSQLYEGDAGKGCYEPVLELIWLIAYDIYVMINPEGLGLVFVGQVPRCDVFGVKYWNCWCANVHIIAVIRNEIVVKDNIITCQC